MNALAGLYDNPILRKHIRSRLRPQHLIPSIIVVVIICGCVVWGGHLLNGMNNGSVFTTLLFIQWGLLLVMGTSQVGSAVAHAKDSGILDFHRVSPLPASWVTMGFLIGAPIREYVMFACSLPFSFIPAAMGTPGAAGLVTIFPVLVVSSVMFHAMAVLVGLISKRPRGAGGSVVGLAVLVHFIGSPALFGGAGTLGLLTVVPTYTEAMRGLDLVLGVPGFFGVAMPLFVQSLIYQFALLFFLFAAAVRKMRSDRAHAYSKPLAAAFLITVAALAMGTLWSSTGPSWLRPVSSMWPVVSVLYILVAAAVLLTVSVTPSASDFANGIRRAGKLGLRRLKPWNDFAPNRWTIAVFCGIVLVAAAASSFMVDWSVTGALGGGTRGAGASFWLPGIVALLAVAYFGFSRQYFELTFGKRAAPYFLLFLFFAWLVPVIAGTIVAMSRWGEDASLPILSLSPIVGIAAASGFDNTGVNARGSQVASWSISLALTLLFGWLSFKAELETEQKLRGPSSK